MRNYRRFRNLNTVGSTAGAPSIDKNSKTPHARATLIGGHPDRKADVIIIVVLVVAMILLSERNNA
jgi:hypothetical protein